LNENLAAPDWRVQRYNKGSIWQNIDFFFPGEEKKGNLLPVGRKTLVLLQTHLPRGRKWHRRGV
jgi:hypothetical protein